MNENVRENKMGIMPIPKLLIYDVAATDIIYAGTGAV